MIPPKKEKLIYVTPSLSSFVQNDLRILADRYYVVINTYRWDKKRLTPFFLIQQFFFLVKNIFNSQAIMVSFGGYWAFLPMLLGKLIGIKRFIILNGTDCAAIPSLHYGNLRKQPLKWFCKQSYKMATCLLPVSPSLVFTENNYVSDQESRFQGFRYFFPGLRTPYRVVLNGCDPAFWTPIPNISRKPETFLTVFSDAQFYLKGGDLIVQLAERFRQCTFYVAGSRKPDFLKPPKNMIFLGRLSPEALRKQYASCTFYLQLSVFEGFGCSLAEAMLCGCIPIGSAVNHIPAIIGEAGFIVRKKDFPEAETVLKRALETKDKAALAKKARKHIIENFSLEKRKQALFSLLEEYKISL